jgi:hypothetical protein
MKKLLVILILIFTLPTPSQADDISDFQIEGMSVGDSLLDYFSEEEIKKEKQYEFNYNDIFATIGFKKNYFKVYDKVQFHYKLKDKNYKIYGIVGVIKFKNSIKDCFNKKDEIVSELSEFYKDVARKDDKGTKSHGYDKTGDSKTTSVYFYFHTGGFSDVACYDWSEKLTKEKGWKDELRITIASEEFRKFLKVAF